ncbi:hypothetical protein LWM68_14830 [Niabella sp. W65]|nr:hypothetical protein [Niabella sp. W65]MCH7363918.1 hypothetical protein [Niabella sp. W65]
MSNGVLHKIDKAIAPLQSIWEYILDSKSSFLQNNYISTLNYIGQDPNLAELDSINPATESRYINRVPVLLTSILLKQRY